jgi:hypothetical protein
LLETLFISDCLDLVEWIQHQESIQGIGVFTDDEDPDQSQLRVCHALLLQPNPRRLFNLWFVMGGGTTDGTTNAAIRAFPAFSRQWSAKPIWDSLQRMEYQNYVWDFKLHLACLSDEDTLRSALASIARYFPHILNLELIVHDRDIHLVRVFSSPTLPDITISDLGYTRAPQNPHILSSTLSLIPNLRFLVVGFDVDNDRSEEYQNDTAGLAAVWRIYCPNLVWVLFPDGSTVTV